jgi:hypothetical protein
LPHHFSRTLQGDESRRARRAAGGVGHSVNAHKARAAIPASSRPNHPHDRTRSHANQANIVTAATRKADLATNLARHQ